MEALLKRANAAKSTIANLDESTRNATLLAMADFILTSKTNILNANKIDLERAKGILSESMLERLRLDAKKINAMAEAIKEISALKSPLGCVIGGWVNKAGLKINKVSTPLGVIAIIYESRPNVTSDCAALCFKSGNICILKGGSEAKNSNLAILNALHNALKSQQIPINAINFIESRSDTKLLLKQDKFIDLVIPRGGEQLIKFVSEHSNIPVIKHDKGVCHLYIHSDAECEMALQIAINAKAQKPSVCNAIECILVHKDWEFLDDLIKCLKQHKIRILAFGALAEKFNLEAAKEGDFYSEYGNLTLNLKLVDGLDSAICHIETFGSHHSESIITNDIKIANRFLDEVDSACVYVNASTRFSDGGEFGFGAEIGISTSKLHARGPMGLEHLVSYKYKIIGNGQIRA